MKRSLRFLLALPRPLQDAAVLSFALGSGIVDKARNLRRSPVAGFVAVLALLHALALAPRRSDGHARAELTTIAILIVVDVAIALLAAHLAKKKEKSIARDDKPTTVATRGAYAPWIVGRQRVGPIVCYAGIYDRVITHDRHGGKGGGSSTKETVYHEAGWHVLALGPVSRLHAIYSSGKPIFVGPIDPSSHPSGTVVDVGNEGSFSIYWGEATQPVNTFLGDVNRIGINSRWPYFCYVLWNHKRLGSQAVWPLLDYEIETRPFNTKLVESPSWLPGSLVPHVASYVPDVITEGAPGTAEFEFDGPSAAAAFHAGGWLRVSGTGDADGDYRVKSTFTTLTGSPYTSHVILADAFTTSATSCTVTPLIPQQDDGANLAHILDQLLFEPYPHGIGQDRLNDYDVQSLEELGQLCETEGLKGRAFALDGESAAAVVGSLIQDIGFMLPLDPTTGLLRFWPMRKVDDADAPYIEDGTLEPPLPEIDELTEETPTDKIVYTFSNRARNFRDDTIPYDDDEQQIQAGRPRIQKVQIPSAIDYSVASQIAERREQEDLAGNVRYVVWGNRDSGYLFPGVAVRVKGLPGKLRILETTPEPTSGKVKLEGIADHYGADASSFGANPVGGAAPAEDLPLPDLQADILEIPPYLFTGKQMFAAVPRIRATITTAFADIHASADDVTYSLVEREDSVQTGGTLLDAMTVADEMVIANGPTITGLGPDLGSALDLSGDDTGWRLGRQLCLIDDELFYLQKLTALGGGVYRLDGLMRARYSTARAAHSIGARVYVFADDALQEWQDALLAPDALLYAKTQPSTGQSLPLSLCVPVSKTLYGRGIKPMPVQNVMPSSGILAYISGDVAHRWTYFSAIDPGTGAGLQNAGVAHSPGSVDGGFLVRIYTTGNVLKRQTTVTTNAYTYTAADRTADALDGLSYKIGVTAVAGGYSSPEVVVTVAKIT